MTLAKGLAGGLPCGAIVARPQVAASLKPGMHASTFGGNPVVTRAGLATVETIEQEGLFENVQRISNLFRQRLEALAGRCPVVEEVRILGLMIGIQLSVDGTAVVQHCMERGVLVNCTQSTVVRLLPALNLTAELCEEGCAVVEEAIEAAAEQA